MAAAQRISREAVGIPPRPFLYTPDQIATLIGVSSAAVKKDYLHYHGRSVGARPRFKMVARNIKPEGDKPEWRIAEQELFRWMRAIGFRFHERGWIKD